MAILARKRKAKSYHITNCDDAEAVKPPLRIDHCRCRVEYSGNWLLKNPPSETGLSTDYSDGWFLVLRIFLIGYMAEQQVLPLVKD